jgi:mono/diheme cytochrome c family protein
MNTSKQVNAMIGLLFVMVIIFAANVLNEPNRQEQAWEQQQEDFVERGAVLFVNNCRGCHGLEGRGREEGAIAPALNADAYLILNEGNERGADTTALGVAQTVRDFLGDTISCGRKGTYMPVWSDEHGGPLSDQQIDYLVTMITTDGAWEIVKEVAHKLDAHQVPVPTRDDIIVDGSGLTITAKNCGQWDALSAKEIHNRDPFVSTGNADATPAPGGTAEPGGTAAPGDGQANARVQDVPVAEFFQLMCSGCHGADRAGIAGLGLPLLPSALVKDDEFYADTIKNGRAGTVMPPWGQQGLTDDDINALVQWIKNVEP